MGSVVINYSDLEHDGEEGKQEVGPVGSQEAKIRQMLNKALFKMAYLHQYMLYIVYVHTVYLLLPL